MDIKENLEKTQYINGLDGIRGIFCFMVVTHHLPVNILRLPFPLGLSFLQCFFILSGYLISSILIQQKELPFKKYLGRFYLNRFFRIVPLYFFYLLIISLVGFLFRNNPMENNLGIWKDLLQNWKLYMSFTSSYSEWYNYSHDKEYYLSIVNAHLWSLSVEMQFYILFPFVVYFLSIRQIKWLLVVVIIATPFLRLICYSNLNDTLPLVSATLAHYEKKELLGWILHHSSVFQLDAFATGACLAFFNFSKLRINKKALWILIVICIVVLSVNYSQDMRTGNYDSWLDCIYSHTMLIRHHHYFYLLTMSNVIAAILIYLTVNGNGFKLFEHPYSVGLGKISYSMYILQFFVLVVYMILVFIGGLIFGFNFQDFMRGKIGFELLYITGYMILLITISRFTYEFIELRFTRIGKKVKSKLEAKNRMGI